MRSIVWTIKIVFILGGSRKVSIIIDFRQTVVRKTTNNYICIRYVVGLTTILFTRHKRVIMD